jgi:mannose-6-phosphate isomerase-like protein (cupin superfamily)
MKESGQNLVEKSNSMPQITKESILLAKKNKKVIVASNFWEQVPDWSDVFNIFKLANKKNSVHFNSFGTCTIDKSEQYSDIFDSFIDKLSLIHPGKKIAVFSIIHFITKHDNTIKDEVAKIFKEDFINKNPHPMPNPLPPKEAFEPTIHSDAVDGFFTQFAGSTLWRVYDNNNLEQESYILNSGDLIFIPKNLKHSVESLCPRNAISISFSD